MTEQPRTAVVILNWNGAELLQRYLPTVVAATPPHTGRVIVADNGSTDGSLDLLSRHFPEVDVIALGHNYGFAEGYNRALRQISEPYAVLLNSDVRTPQGWLQPLADYLDGHPDVGAVQPKLLHDRTDGREVFEYAGAAGGYLDRHGFPYCRGRIFGTIEDDRGQYDTGHPDLLWASGACLMVRTELYRRVGGLDPAFFAHMEEIDLCWRILLAGSHIRLVPQSRVYHLGGGTLPQGNPKKTYLNFRNNLLLLHKNLPPRRARRVLAARMLYDGLAAAQALLRGHFADVNAIRRAHRDFRRMRHQYPTGNAPAVDLLSQMPEGRRNIVTDYYLRRRKTFRSNP